MDGRKGARSAYMYEEFSLERDSGSLLSTKLTMGPQAGWSISPGAGELAGFRVGQIIAYRRWHQYHDPDGYTSPSDHQPMGYAFLKIAAIQPGSAQVKSNISLGRGSAAYLRKTYPRIVVQSPDGRSADWLFYQAERRHGPRVTTTDITAVLTEEARMLIFGDLERASGNWRLGYSRAALDNVELAKAMGEEKTRRAAETQAKERQAAAAKAAQLEADAAARARAAENARLADQMDSLFRQL